eukprot:16074859-Heterocapsa_arctica.AAC.1
MPQPQQPRERLLKSLPPVNVAKLRDKQTKAEYERLAVEALSGRDLAPDELAGVIRETAANFLGEVPDSRKPEWQLHHQD